MKQNGGGSVPVNLLRIFHVTPTVNTPSDHSTEHSPHHPGLTTAHKYELTGTCTSYRENGYKFDKLST